MLYFIFNFIERELETLPYLLNRHSYLQKKQRIYLKHIEEHFGLISIKKPPLKKVVF